MLRPLLGDFGSIALMQARALRGALALQETDPDRLAAWAGTLSVLAAAADRTDPRGSLRQAIAIFDGFGAGAWS